MLRIYTGGGCPISGPSAYNRKANLSGPALTEQRYDQIQFSAHLDETGKRVRETVGRLSQEARARVTTRDVEQLRRQVASGEYQPSAHEIAARMLLVRGGN